MSFLTSALTTGTGLLEQSPFETLADGAQVPKGVAELATDGPSWAGASDLVGGGAKVGVDLLRDNEELGLGEDLLPGIGPLIGGLATTAGGLGGMYQHADQAGQGYFSNDEGGRNEYWGSAGDATLGAVHAGLGTAALLGLSADTVEAPSVLGVPLEALSLPETAAAIAADASLSAGETAVNGVGFAAGLTGSAINAAEGLHGEEAHDWYFGAGDVVGLAEHGAYDGLGALAGAALGGGSAAAAPAAAPGPAAADCFRHYGE